MIEKSLWQQIKDVVDCDKQIAALNNTITDLQKGISHDTDLESQRNAILHEKQRLLFEAQKNSQLKELTLKELKETEAQKRLQLDAVKNQKEYKAFQSEIESLAAQRNKQEEESLKHLYLIDKLKAELETLQQSDTEKHAILEHDKQIKADNLAHLQTTLLETVQKRETAIQHVPSEWRIQYERMKQSVPDPIVPVLDGSCSACYYAVLFHDLAKLKKSQLVVCRNCYRFLYYDESEEKSLKQPNY
jgi:predicted  nucleic acid-binding Zn-ribbon protein